jgi:hypothetical protein
MGTSACFRISTWSRDCAKGRLDSRFRDTGKDSADFRQAPLEFAAFTLPRGKSIRKRFATLYPWI